MKIVSNLKRPLVYVPVTIVLLILILVGGYKWLNKAPAEQTTTAVKGDFISQVSVTGKVIPVKSVDLAFESSGRISAVYKNVGNTVGAGEIIAALNSSELQASLDKAKADLAGEEAKLEQLQTSSGLTTEDTTAKRKLLDSILGGYTSADDAIRNKTDQFFTDPDTMNPQILFAFSDYDLKQKINSERIVIEETLKAWQKLDISLSATSVSNFDAEKARTYLIIIKSFLDDVSNAVNNFEINSTLSQTTIDKYKNDVASARNNINLSLSALTVAEEASRSTSSDKSVQEARVMSAEATVSSINAQIAQTLLLSPFNGVVTVQNAKEGEIASPNVPIVSVISASNFEIEAYVPESDIAKVKVGQSADVTLDAYGRSVVFKATVAYIDPAETIKEGVATYKTTLEFTNEDDRIKSGMTANTDIETDRRSGIITLSQRAIINQDGGKFVIVKEGNLEIQKPITTGKIDEKGEIEIISGLSGGETIVIKKQ